LHSDILGNKGPGSRAAQKINFNVPRQGDCYIFWVDCCGL
jgi:hypothetical protein